MSDARILTLLAATAGLLVASACSPERPFPSTPERTPSNDAGIKVLDDVRSGAQGTDREFLEIADSVPGFAGYYLTSAGEVRTLIAGSTDTSGAARFVRPRLRASHRSSRLAARSATFGFAALYGWKVALRAIAAGGGIVTVGVDVTANVVRLRVVDVAARRRIEAFAIENGIPASALRIEEVERAYAPDLSGNPARTLMAGTTNLRVYRSPLSGGWQIAWWDSGSSGLCTATATLKQSTSKVFLSAAHCGQRFATTGTRFDQPTLGNRIGAEISDAVWLPANTGVCQFGNGVDCRYSDGVVGLYDVATRGALGSVGKPILRNPTYSDPNVVTVDGLNSTFSIAGTYPYPHVGETVDHVGRTTGWQSGTVAETCTDMYRLDAPTNRNFVLLCQSRVTATSGKGDSGGPAFFYNSEMNSVTLVGMVWSGGGLVIGSNSEGNTIYSEMWMSPWENISIDYPGLSIQ